MSSDFEDYLRSSIMGGAPRAKMWHKAWAPPFAGQRSPTKQALTGLPKAVYFIVVGDVVKIGVSSDLQKRVLALKTGLAHQIDAIYVDAGVSLSEKTLHEKFKTHRMEGEWFILADEIKEYIDECRRTAVLVDHPTKRQRG